MRDYLEAFTHIATTFMTCTVFFIAVHFAFKYW